MTLTDEILRGILTAMAFAALVLGGAVMGQLWHSRGWPLRTVTLGCLLVLTYVLAGQAKAYLIGIPFDYFSWLGMVAYVVLLTGIVWSILHERRGR